MHQTPLAETERQLRRNAGLAILLGRRAGDEVLRRRIEQALAPARLRVDAPPAPVTAA